MHRDTVRCFETLAGAFGRRPHPSVLSDELVTVVYDQLPAVEQSIPELAEPTTEQPQP